MQNKYAEEQEVLDSLSVEAKEELFNRFLARAKPTMDLNKLLQELLKQVQQDFRS